MSRLGRIIKAIPQATRVSLVLAFYDDDPKNKINDKSSQTNCRFMLFTVPQKVSCNFICSAPMLPQATVISEQVNEYYLVRQICSIKLSLGRVENDFIWHIACFPSHLSRKVSQAELIGTNLVNFIILLYPYLHPPSAPLAI